MAKSLLNTPVIAPYRLAAGPPRPANPPRHARTPALKPPLPATRTPPPAADCADKAKWESDEQYGRPICAPKAIPGQPGIRIASPGKPHRRGQSEAANTRPATLDPGTRLGK